MVKSGTTNWAKLRHRVLRSMAIFLLSLLALLTCTPPLCPSSLLCRCQTKEGDQANNGGTLLAS